jgi:hypothetical protein
METIIYVPLEVISAMKPWAGADEDFTVEPLRAVIAGGGTVIRRTVIVAIRTIRGNADFNVDLSFRLGRDSREANSDSSG